MQAYYVYLSSQLFTAKRKRQALPSQPLLRILLHHFPYLLLLLPLQLSLMNLCGETALQLLKSTLVRPPFKVQPFGQLPMLYSRKPIRKVNFNQSVHRPRPVAQPDFQNTGHFHIFRPKCLKEQKVHLTRFKACCLVRHFPRPNIL